MIVENLRLEVPVMLLYVLNSTGSSPGRQGFFMAIDALGKMEGSIGGGIMEHKLVELSKQWLLGKEKALNSGTVKKQEHNKFSPSNQSGMICSGRQTVLLYPVKKTEAAQIAELISCLEQNQTGTLQLSPHGICFSPKQSMKEVEFHMQSEDEWLYLQKIGYKNHLHIVGGGHCSLALSQLMSVMDFYIHLYEDRPGLHTMELNQYVQEKKIVSSYQELTSIDVENGHHYVVIMTVGYRSDEIALRAILDKPFIYIGLLGSSHKIKKMWETLRKESIPEQQIQKIHAPIGLPIKSETPAEIAVSIAAEIIKVKNSVVMGMRS